MVQDVLLVYTITPCGGVEFCPVGNLNPSLVFDERDVIRFLPVFLAASEFVVLASGFC